MLYAKALQAPFVYDDLDQIVNNPALTSWHPFVHRFLLAPVALTGDFRQIGGLSYRPVFWISLALDRALWGLHAPGFHLTSLFLHLANGCVAFHVFRRLRISLSIAAAASLLWLGLPINSEVVAWISARAYSLSTLFLLLALVAALSFAQAAKPIALTAYALLAALALLTHEQGLLLLPLTLLLLFSLGKPRQRSWVALPLISIAADLLFAALRRFLSPPAPSGPPALWAVGLSFWKYLQWMTLPLHMSVERSTSVPPNLAGSAALLAWCGAVALLALALLIRSRRPLLTGGLLWLILALAPFCGAVFIYQGMAERFVYLATAGLSLAIADLVFESRREVRPLLLGVALLWILWGTVRLRSRVADWTDPVALYRNSLEATPQSASLSYNTGFALRDQGDLDQAETYYLRAIQLRPGYERAFASLGDLYTRERRLPEAEAAYNRALTIEPDDAGTILNRAVALEQAGSAAAAQLGYERVIALAPNDTAAYTDLGTLFFAQGRSAEAADMFEKAIRLQTSDPTPYFNLAALHQQSGHDDLALPLYRKVLELKPGDPDTLANMQKLHLPPLTQ